MQGIEVGFPFVRKSANPIDATLTLTKAQMVDINDSLMPDKYFTVCQDDGAIYLYDKEATASATTGKFKKFEGGGTDSIELTQAQYDALPDEQKNNGTIYFITDGQGGGGGSYVLPPATASTLGGVKVGSGLSVTSDGTLSATGGSGGGDANFEVDEQNNMANVNNNVQYLTMDFNDSDTLGVAAYNPGTYMASRTLATKDYVDAHAGTTYTAGTGIDIDSNNVVSNKLGSYSSTEQVVGTWIDGSTLYRKTLTIPRPYVSSLNNGLYRVHVDIGIDDWDQIYDVDAMGYVNNIRSCHKLPYVFVSTSQKNALMIERICPPDSTYAYPNTICFLISSENNSADFYNAFSTFYVTLTYTKKNNG